MGAVRVHRLALRLVAPAALREQAPALRSRAETLFVPALLQALAQRLEGLYGPDAVLRIPSLRLKLRLPAAGLAVAAYADLLSDDLARQVQAWLRGQSAGEPADGSPTPARWYRDKAQLQAVRLVAAARGIEGPTGAREAFGGLWSGIAAAPSHERTAVLLELARTPGREVVIAHWPPAQVRRVLRWSTAQAPHAWKVELRHQLRGTQLEPGCQQDLVPAPGGIATPVEASTGGRMEGAAAEPEEMAARPALKAKPSRSRDRKPERPPSRRHAQSSAAPLAPPEWIAGYDGEPAAPSLPGEMASAQAPVTQSPALPANPTPAGDEELRAPTQRATGRVAPDSLVTEEACSPCEDDIEPASRWASRWCGLPYLLNISLRLELPERLWQAGLPEGDVLAAMFARIAGTDEDPAVRLLSPAFPGTPAALPPVPAWVCEELTTGVAQAALRWPALRPQHEALLARVAELQAWLAAGAAFDLPAWGAAWHLAIAEALLQERLAPADLARRFAGEGVIACEGEALRIIQPMQAVDVAVRRAGLDADPGWLAWLRKRLVFVFEGAASLEQ